MYHETELMQIKYQENSITVIYSELNPELNVNECCVILHDLS